VSCKETPRRTELTPDWFRKVANRVKRYFADQSGGRLLCDFVVYDWLELSITGEEWWHAGPAVGDTARSEAASYHGFNETDFERFVIVVDERTIHAETGEEHLSQLGVTDYKTDTRIAAIDATPTIVAHELAHAFGARHTRLETPQGPQDYGGPFCVMGFERGKYGFFDPDLIVPEIGAHQRHAESGPGMCLASLSQTGWLNTDMYCQRVVPYSGGSLATTVRIAALNGAPSGPIATPIGCLIDTYDRFSVEYRRPDTYWDTGLAERVPAANGWLVIYRSPIQDKGLTALQVATLEVIPGATIAIDNHPYYLFGSGPMRVSVTAVDPWSRTVDFRLDRPKSRPPQYFPTERIEDMWQWPIEYQPVVQPDEPIDQLVANVAQLRELRRLERLSGPRAAPQLREQVLKQAKQLQRLVANLDL
jgi:hypothetical protein